MQKHVRSRNHARTWPSTQTPDGIHRTGECMSGARPKSSAPETAATVGDAGHCFENGSNKLYC